VLSRMPDGSLDELRVSRSLAKLALFTNRENTLWVRGVGDSSDFRGLDAQSLKRAESDWAICAPLYSSENRRKWTGIYLVGKAPPRPMTETAKVPHALKQLQEIVDASVQIFKSVFDMIQAQEKVTRYEHYLPKRISEILTLSNAKETQQPRETDVAVLFCDLRGSCKQSGESTDGLLAEWKLISDVLSDMTSAISNNAGVVGDLVGDAAMGFWGWPFDDPDRVLRAARAAVQILSNFERTAHRLGRQYRCGIGIAHGKAVAGEIGPFDFRKFGVFGPVVNLASRLESMTKMVGVPIVIEESAASAIIMADPDAKEFMLRRFPVIRPAGMSLQTRLFELCPPKTYVVDYLDDWDRAVYEFEKGRWPKCRELLERLQRHEASSSSNSRAIRSHGEFLLSLMTTPEAPSGWDGIIRLDKK
jgi:adenylate cyclase